MASSSNPYEHYNSPQVEDDLIDPDDGKSFSSLEISDSVVFSYNSELQPLPNSTAELAIANLDDLDDPLQPRDYSSRAPLTGNIGSSSSSRPLNENYLTSTIPGEDRRAPTNTIDESVWDTLRRDILAVWSKMREVLYPKYIFGGSMIDNTTSLRGAYESIRTAGFTGARDEVRNLAGRAIDADNLLSQSNMSPGLRDWDLWGPLVFCLMLSMLLSFRAEKDPSAVFSGIFAMIWLGEAVVTVQIKLLGGNM
jgi:protein YIPF6